MGRKKVTVFKEIEDETFKRITYSKRKKGIIKKAVEISLLCGQEVMLTIFNKVNNKLVIYQSTPEFGPSKVNDLLKCPNTLTLYEEHTNFDFTQKGNTKQQTFDFRKDERKPETQANSKKRQRQKQHWKICQNSSWETKIAGSDEEEIASNERKVQKLNIQNNDNELTVGFGEQDLPNKKQNLVANQSLKSQDFQTFMSNCQNKPIPQNQPKKLQQMKNPSFGDDAETPVNQHPTHEQQSFNTFVKFPQPAKAPDVLNLNLKDFPTLKPLFMMEPNTPITRERSRMALLQQQSGQDQEGVSKAPNFGGQLSNLQNRCDFINQHQQSQLDQQSFSQKMQNIDHPQIQIQPSQQSNENLNQQQDDSYLLTPMNILRQNKFKDF